MPKVLLAAMFGLSLGGTAGDHPAPPKAELDLAPPADTEKTRTAIFAGGCFWCTEGVFEQLEGVSEVVSGYDGDSKDKATYRRVCDGDTNHAEAIKITYDPRKITYARLLRVFFALHDPTTLDRQGPDSGHQYRSAIFYETDEQKKVAQAYIDQLTKAKYFDAPIVTTLEPVGAGFFPAEEYHQGYTQLHPDQPYICQVALPKIEKLKKLFPEEIKKK
jgi:peptide-methionine (S)-S-oxide reductase